MPNYSGKWNLAGQLQGIKAGTWTGLALPVIYAWGHGSFGTVGNNAALHASSPIQVGSLQTWSSVVSSTLFNSAAIRGDGTLWTWGRNNQGNLGADLASTYNASSPVQVGTNTNWSDISMSNLSGAITTDGELYAWGYNAYGGVGDNTRVTRSSPVQIGALTNWSSVSGVQGNLFAIKTDGTLWSWGRSLVGEGGHNDQVARSSPVQIGTGTDWYKIADGDNGTFMGAIKTDGTLWMWGNNGVGQIGDDTVTYRSSPVQIGLETNWADIAVGETQAVAVKTDGTMWSWGGNGTYGELGQNDLVLRSSPTQIGSLTNWSTVAAGHNNAAAIKTDGTLWSWGENTNGQLAQDNVVNVSSPVQIGSETNWTSVSCGYAMIAGFEERTGM